MITKRIEELVGAEVVLGNEMKAKILGVSPVEYDDDIEQSINFSEFRLKLESGSVVTLNGSNIAVVHQTY